MGANAVILVVATILVGGAVVRGDGASQFEMVFTIGGLLAVMFLLNFWLVTTAVRPIRSIEAVARRVAEGDFDARVEPSRLDDRDARQLGVTINLLLAALATERRRFQHDAARVIDNADNERARLARELLDSTAQNLAGLAFQLEALSTDNMMTASSGGIRAARDLAAETIEELRTMALALYPTVLDDLGLGAALRYFAARVSEESGVRISVHSTTQAEDLSRPVRSALYRVAEEAVLDAVQSPSPSPVEVRLQPDRGWMTLDVTVARPQTEVTGEANSKVLNMRARLALVGGVLGVGTLKDGATRLTARVPVHISPSHHLSPALHS